VQVEVPSASYLLTLFAGEQIGCVIDEQQEVTLAACTNLTLNLFRTEPLNADADNQLFIVGCVLPESTNDVAAFCGVLPDLQGVPDELGALFAGTDINDLATYPEPAAIEAFVGQVDALLDAGDAVVPKDVRSAWLTATDGLRELVAGLAAASFDFQTIVDNNPEQAQELLDAAEGEAPPDPETDAAIETLTAFFLENCVPPEPPAPPTPVAVTPRFTG
jgi:hypothetical protein